jgi:RNA polymerase sigma factor (sigma-70 family)
MLNLVSELEKTNPLTAKYYIGIVGLAKKLSVRYGQEYNEDDFIQIALATACRYESKHNADKANFYTYCVKPITTAIHLEFGNQNSTTKVYKSIALAIKEFQDTNGNYPDVQQIQEVTGLSISDIIGVYYDKYRDISLQSLGDDIEIRGVFDIDGNAWIDEHFSTLTEQELLVIDAIYYRDQSIKTIANLLNLSVNKLEQVHKSALAKLKLSIGDFE